jgi:hypothetical protein
MKSVSISAPTGGFSSQRGVRPATRPGAGCTPEPSRPSSKDPGNGKTPPASGSAQYSQANPSLSGLDKTYRSFALRYEANPAWSAISPPTKRAQIVSCCCRRRCMPPVRSIMSSRRSKAPRCQKTILACARIYLRPTGRRSWRMRWHSEMNWSGQTNGRPITHAESFYSVSVRFQTNC